MTFLFFGIGSQRLVSSLLQTEQYTLRRRGRRYQHPTFLAILANMMLAAILAGFAISHVWLMHVAVPYSRFSHIACMIAMLLPIALFVRGDDHELDPICYTRDENQTTSMYKRCQSALGLAAASLGIAFVVIYLTDEHYPPFSALKTLLSFLHLAILCLWLSWFDHNLRQELFSSDFEEDVDITVMCLLESGPIVDRLIALDYQGPMDFQGLHKMESLIKDMGTYMTTKVEDQIECPLEQDMLRFIVLQSLGGGVDSAVANPFLSIPTVQREHIMKHIATKYVLTSSFGPHRVQILVKGLCVFAGGLGQALHIASEKRKFRFTEEKWKVPPGAIVEMHYVLQAITRIFKVGLTFASPDTATQLARLVPAVMSAIFRLRTGIVAVVEHSKGFPIQLNAIHIPRFYRVVEECDKAAAVIFSTQVTVTTEQIPLLPLDNMAIEWLRHCVAHSRNS